MKLSIAFPVTHDGAFLPSVRAGLELLDTDQLLRLCSSVLTIIERTVTGNPNNDEESDFWRPSIGFLPTVFLHAEEALAARDARPERDPAFALCNLAYAYGVEGSGLVPSWLFTTYGQDIMSAALEGHDFPAHLSYPETPRRVAKSPAPCAGEGVFCSCRRTAYVKALTSPDLPDLYLSQECRRPNRYYFAHAHKDTTFALIDSATGEDVGSLSGVKIALHPKSDLTGKVSELRGEEIFTAPIDEIFGLEAGYAIRVKGKEVAMAG